MKKVVLTVLMSAFVLTLAACDPDYEPSPSRKCPRFQPGDNPYEGAPHYCPESP